MFFLKMICKPIAHPIYMSICHYLPIPPLRPVQQTSRHLRPLFDPKTILRGRLFARARARPPAALAGVINLLRFRKTILSSAVLRRFFHVSAFPFGKKRKKSMPIALPMGVQWRPKRSVGLSIGDPLEAAGGRFILVSMTSSNASSSGLRLKSTAVLRIVWTRSSAISLREVSGAIRINQVLGRKLIQDLGEATDRNFAAFQKRFFTQKSDVVAFTLPSIFCTSFSCSPSTCFPTSCECILRTTGPTGRQRTRPEGEPLICPARAPGSHKVITWNPFAPSMDQLHPHMRVGSSEHASFCFKASKKRKLYTASTKITEAPVNKTTQALSTPSTHSLGFSRPLCLQFPFIEGL